MTSCTQGQPENTMREKSPVGRTLGVYLMVHSGKTVWGINLYWHRKWLIDCLTGQGLGKNKIGWLVTKRSKREAWGLSEWEQSVQAVVFYVNTPQRTQQERSIIRQKQDDSSCERQSVSFPSHLVFAQWTHGKSSHGGKNATCGLNVNFSSPRITWLELPLNAQTTMAEAKTILPVWHHSHGTSQLPGGKLITVALFTSWRWEWFVLMGVHSSTDSGLPL